MKLFTYALAIVLVILLVFFAWHLWCVAVIKFVNPILDGLNAAQADIRMCGRTSDTLQRVSNWAKQFNRPETPPADETPPTNETPPNTPISPILLAQAGLIVLLVATITLILVMLYQLIKIIQANQDSDSSKEEQAEAKTPGPILSRKKEAGEKDEVFFTAIHPRKVNVETWCTLLVYAHLQSALDKVIQDAEQFKSELKHSKETSSSTITRLARGTEITIIPTCKNVTFNPERVSLKWMEDFQRAHFRFQAKKSLLDRIARGQISVYVGPLLVCSVNLLLNFVERADSASHDYQTHPKAIYHQDDIFVSYSHKDAKIVRACREAYKALGFNVLIDVDMLRSGQFWNEELMALIERANIFQLFWSKNYSKSEYCKKEWEYALSLRRREGFIRPLYWRKPLAPPPPKKLSKFHFQFMDKITLDK